ncbi:MAG: methylenetetrahydrofolate reductase C-terminal domain-containing protein [Candidatus Omnitrophica bacterium]|jgi:ferredoxin|nr:methylenetetrahydrofolate reductase C-terminal domain-containing protein [Candidatus Omnitrophota bacterium]
MIITEQKPLAEILESLKNYNKIFLVGCGDCATACKTGGEADVVSIQKQIENSGRTVTGVCIPDAACVAAKLKSAAAKHMQAMRASDAVLIFSCGLGVQSFKDNDRLNLAVLPGCNTLSAAVLDSRGDLFEKCAMCGQCVLGETFGICPVALCPKGLLNGPCGGMNKGKCELDPERDCAWVLIYKEAGRKNSLDSLKKIQSPRDHKRSVKPHKLIVNQAVSK